MKNLLVLFLLLTSHNTFGQNVGINNTSPTDRLHVSASSGQDALRVQVNGQTKLRTFKNGGTTIGVNNTSGTPTDGLYVHGNTGLGVSNPDDKLAVEGDVNIDGAIKASGVNGTPGQMLVTGSNGNIEWASPCNYNRFQGFPAPGVINWDVPADVTELLIEAWGAGGGGAAGGGGGAGGYSKAIFLVVPGETLVLTVGAGGDGVLNGANSNATDGGTSSVIGANITIAAFGGEGSTTSSPGAGGAYSIGTALSSTAKIGESGFFNVSTPFFDLWTKLTFGNGGQSPCSEKNYGHGELRLTKSTSTQVEPGSSGTSPGGGGGGGGQFGHKGGDGFIILHWK